MSLTGLKKSAPGADNQQKIMNSTPSTLSDLARRHVELTKSLKELDGEKKEVREEFFNLATSNIADYELPTYPFRIPQDFLDSCKMSLGQFLTKHQPSWELMSYKFAGTADEPYYEGVLRLRREYAQFQYEDETVSISRSPAVPTPELDWDLMRKLDPEMFDEIARPRISWELDEEALGEFLAENPEAVQKIQLYAIHKPPTLRVLAKVKDG